jgi:hypothetical protein
MKELTNQLTTQKYTKIYYMEDSIENGAPHDFVVTNVKTGEILSEIEFQQGPIKEVGVNGIHNEDLIAMVLERLYGFQETDFRCRENAIAITKLEEALMWLRKRTTGREIKGVEGTSKK